ncbi:MAG: hypothetical protein A3B74_05250 [Candidatus Kerfeldbacteria bacterium RIFCSPHIGHO2_02_FULL_42_14]|uniref:Uncharacterized protein n=1 Tax=Candidatus Kerfeldbacteria bacterium RIFCSPHIGHO2_02_FULL_42_14 TaxID=1798540 RepID=A0A1G2AT05_9BACT|nr:MAG: hypothetical protein A3B74_05250 [Candidatus Kerfeldbacteria bacterium RIFCSPHIGHO2_02_FULL_42_14]OGY81597.1 MAG: hypothetical protein A3E60_01995 [Candidatus Kerfeldbacteria bacterium RIFCSPHIGHO2_12_FULL_42_13]OGY83200.1 MAG: hypothetical protein A3I91_03405 [Candidatus Kerfeldbacteria bacterium RIFCSPLOWO2_02_FULL_42_19]OGY86247.1 MAG: hypothetical protein A3G01_00215 [Candidatus Kerfeldbacteria bacterium RIFCSPLOWO2_12_FULL_43_9]
MEIPAFIILIVYGVIVFLFCILAFFNIYHAIRFGIFDTAVKFVTLIFILVSLGIFFITGLFLAESHWRDAKFFIDIPTFSADTSKNVRN